MPALPNRLRVTLIVALILVGLLLSMYWAGRLAEQRAWAERGQESQGQLELYAQAIHTQVERFRSVPALLALDSDIQGLLADPDNRALRRELNQRLEQQNHAAGSSVLYLLDRRFPGVKGGFIHVPYATAQGVGKPSGTPTMEIATMAKAIEAAIEAAVSVEEDATDIMGETH